MVNLTIDGKNVTVGVDSKPISTILQAAKSAGIPIPHLCYQKGLSPTSACRLCVVEVEGINGLVASCSYPVEEGMKVFTDTERVLSARRLVLELLLSDHPKDCLVCEKNGVCKLQRYAYEMGIENSRFSGRQHHCPVDSSNPFIERDYNKCILCGRCVTICEEEMGRGVIDYLYRGFETRIGTYFDKPLQDMNCAFCGQCVSVCPVGALTEKQSKGKGRVWEMEKVTTTCPYCGCGCSLDMNVKDDKIVKITSNNTAGINHGRLCVKGRFGYDFIHCADRLKHPLIRKNGELTQSSWDEALGLVAERFSQIRDKSGADSIAGISSARCTNEENFLFQKFMRAVIGTNNVDHCARLCHASTVVGLATAFGSGAMTNAIDEIQDTKCIILTGSNTTECHPIIGIEIRKAVANGAKLIVLDPREIELADIAHLHLQQKPGTDVAWMNAMMNVILSEGLHDQGFIDSRCEGFEGFKAMVEKYTPEYSEEISGIPAEKIRDAARIYARAETACIVYSMGITQHTTGVDNVLCTANLAMLCGNIGKKSSGVLPLRGQNNVQGSCDMGALPNVYSGYQQVTDENMRLKFEQAWGISLPISSGITLTEMLRDNIKALYIMGENPVVSDPDANHVKQALENKEFLVVQDIFLTETAQVADVVLPAVSFAEKDGTFTNTERRVQLIRKAIEPVGEAMADWKIICELASRMGYDMKYYESESQIMDEISALTPSYGGIRYNRLEKGGLQWPCPDMNHPGTPFLHKDKFTHGKGKFSAVEYLPAAELPSSEYPYILTTGRILEHYHTGSMTRRCAGLDWMCKQGFVEMNLVDAENLRVNDGSMVKVSTPRGEIELCVRVVETIQQGVLFIPFHLAEASANVLTNPAIDPKAKIPEFKVCAARVEAMA
ncbi:formate dehydrogenase subunit alpha [Candidatus Desantisbacteria bacterium]|nr:formate dehydrogenase subunit alpha [Candidatus Desantisbacteria bacterium]